MSRRDDAERLEDLIAETPREEFRHELRLQLERTIMQGNAMRRSGISYMHIPARDPKASAAFYRAVFDWELRGDPEHPSFNDGTGDVIGSWVTDIEPAGEAGVLPYIFVANVDETLEKVRANGCEIVREPYAEGQLMVATFRDPAGNVVGVWDHPDARG